MRLRALRIGGIRCIAAARMEIAGDLVVLKGPNGAGKTSVLEAIHLLGHGRSFRARGMEGLVRRGAQGLSVAAVVERAGGLHRASWTWADGVGEARIEGVRRPQAELLALFRVLTQHPGSHALVQGPREERRRFLDWLMFHVEPAFLGVWRDFRRALRQRNAAIRSDAEERALAAWEPSIARAGESIAAWRRMGVERLQAAFAEIAPRLLPDLAGAELTAVDGWPAGLRLEELLARRRAQDRLRGRTEWGPHRGGFELRCGELHGEQLSRGQAKLAALALLLAAAKVLETRDGETPVLSLDDFAADLDGDRQQAVIELLGETTAQVWITTTETPPSIRRWARSMSWFHVERGAVTPGRDYNDALPDADSSSSRA